MPDPQIPAADHKARCPWCLGRPLYVAYHDLEWGVPLHDDRALFELLLLEGAQAGLQWYTILQKREGYRQAFRGFDPEVVARFSEADREALAQDARIVRNRQKIAAAVGNARAFLELAGAFGSFDSYLWRFVDGRPIQNAWDSLAQVPSTTAVSDALSKDLLARGFKFVGSTIMYAFLQSAGLVNDHLTACFRHRELGG